jgi:conjugal transfer pilus assembly protein TraF
MRTPRNSLTQTCGAVAIAWLAATLIVSPLLAVAQASGSNGAGSQDQSGRGHDDTAVDLREDYAEHFLRYEPFQARQKPEPASAPRATATTPPSPAPAASGASKVTVEWLRENYPLLEQRAMDDPSSVNVRAAAYVKRIVLDKASRYASAMQQAVLADPLLNENSRVPYASMGAAAIRTADVRAQASAVRELAKAGGLLVFVDSQCRFCKAQLPILDHLRHEYRLEYLLVTIDGAPIAGSAAAVVRDTGVFAKLGLKLTPSMVFVPKPSGYQGKDPNTYLVVSQGFYAADELTKQIAFAGYQKHLLADATMRDLGVWDRGILETTDLATLRLDPNKPETIPQQIEPLLMKRY